MPIPVRITPVNQRITPPSSTSKASSPVIVSPVTTTPTMPTLRALTPTLRRSSPIAISVFLPGANNSTHHIFMRKNFFIVLSKNWRAHDSPQGVFAPLRV
ncbi:hypothetical protein ASA_P4G120 (plasmid) [Aeromonas salmonicida subsp. salmonicida A449]|uniref:Uncharacterized protein n=1 Tax=Aeromonas salmonicida (strain A449) TaxID=382245 RepID=A4SU48_AERS4|nr:hypothetical protein ASA_P4G120 [Aeromonas salmonicida subsp. salmonicida A449]ASI25672.1 hypothetical protein CE463_00595 [Aeromonas salmonicida]